MAFFLFLGIIFLSYFCYEFLRRIVFKFFEYHPTGEVGSLKSFVSPKTVTSAGRDVLWSDEVQGYKLKIIHISFIEANFYANIHSQLVDLHSQIKWGFTSTVEESKYFQNTNQRIRIDEETDLKRKKKLYISALNIDRPHKYPKIKQLQTVGNLSTIFE